MMVLLQHLYVTQLPTTTVPKPRALWKHGLQTVYRQSLSRPLGNLDTYMDRGVLPPTNYNINCINNHALNNMPGRVHLSIC